MAEEVFVFPEPVTGFDIAEFERQLRKRWVVDGEAVLEASKDGVFSWWILFESDESEWPEEGLLATYHDSDSTLVLDYGSRSDYLLDFLQWYRKFVPEDVKLVFTTANSDIYDVSAIKDAADLEYKLASPGPASLNR
jgi:hypothetical protein